MISLYVTGTCRRVYRSQYSVPPFPNHLQWSRNLAYFRLGSSGDEPDFFVKQQGVVNYSLFTAKKALLTFLSFLLKLLKFFFFCNSFPHMFGYEADAVSWTVSYVELVNVWYFFCDCVCCFLSIKRGCHRNRDALVNVSPPSSSALRNTAKASS